MCNYKSEWIKLLEDEIGKPIEQISQELADKRKSFNYVKKFVLKDMEMKKNQMLGLLNGRAELACKIHEYLNSDEAKENKITGVCATITNNIVTITWEIDDKIEV